MGSQQALTELQKRVSEILDDYLTELESGHIPDEQAIMRANPDLHEYLLPHFSSLRMMQGLKRISDDDQPHATVDDTPRELGDYVLQREIARGGMGIVFEATNKTLHRKVALKVLPFAAVLNQKQIDRFRNEAQAAARLHHPNIVPIYAVGVDRGVHYYAMQFIEGRSLSEALDELRQQFQNGARLPDREVVDGQLASTSPWLSRSASTSADTWNRGQSSAHVPKVPRAGGTRSYGDRDYFSQVAKLGIEVANAMQHAHALGIIHRDIKPSNLLVDQSGKTWVADFGLAHIPSEMSMTRPGDVLGTIRYMSPEQAAGNRYVDHRTDIYSIGITLYELLTLQPAFDCEDSATFLRQIPDVEPPLPRKRNRSVPLDLENIVLKAIAKDPPDRYTTAVELADDLQRFLEGLPTLAKKPSVVDRAHKWARRHRQMVAVAAMFLLAVSILSGTATALLMRERSRTKSQQMQTLAEQRRTQMSLKKAREIVDDLGVRVSEDLASIPGTGKVRSALLLQTESYYQFILDQTPASAHADDSINWDRSVALNNAGKIAKQLGKDDESLAAFRKARRLLEALPHEPRYQQELARCLNDEGLLLAQTGQIELGLDRLDDALAIQSRLRQIEERNAGHRSVRSDYACTQGNRAYLLSQLHDLAASRQAYESSIAWHRRSLEQDGDSTDRRRLLALSIHNLAQILLDSDPQLARRHCLEAIQIQEQLRRESPANSAFQSDLALSYRNLAGFWAAESAWERSIKTYERAIEIESRLIEVAPDIVDYQSDLAITYNNLGEVQLRSKDELGPSRALESFTKSESILRSLVQQRPNDVSYQSSLGGALYNKGEAQLILDRKQEAIISWRAGLAHQKEAVLREPNVPQFREFLAIQSRRLEDIGELAEFSVP